MNSSPEKQEKKINYTIWQKYLRKRNRELQNITKEIMLTQSSKKGNNKVLLLILM
jgi:hypothetical protein